MQLISEFAERGILLWTEDGKLKFRATKSALTTEDKETLKQHKEKIIAYLNHQKELASKAFPLTPIQKSYLTGRDEIYDLGGINTHYYMELTSDIPLDACKMEEALNETIAHCDAMRLIIFKNGTQAVLEDVPHVNIKEYTFTSAEERLKGRSEWNHHIYQLDQWPLFTFRISHVSGEKDILHIDFDCIIMDSFSAKIAITQMLKIYNGETVTWPGYSFKQYSEELSAFESKQDYSAAEAYWKGKVNEIVVEPDLPYAKPLSETHNHRFDRMTGGITKEEYVKLQQVAKNYRSTPSAIVSCVLLKTLLKHSKGNAITITSTLYNRQPLHKDIYSVVGDFTNIAYLTLSKNAGSFLQSIQAVQKEMWQFVRFHSYDGTKILKFKENLRPMKAQLPIVLTCVLDGGKTVNTLPGGIRQTNSLSKTPQVVLDYQVTDFDGSLSLCFDYVKMAFEYSTIKEIMDDNIALLRRLLTEDWNQIE